MKLAILYVDDVQLYIIRADIAMRHWQ